MERGERARELIAGVPEADALAGRLGGLIGFTETARGLDGDALLAHLQLASQFGLAFKLPDDVVGLYSQFGIDLVRYNGNDLWSLPMPGRFVLDQKGNVVSAEANPDYTHRPEPSEIVEVLKKMG